MTKEEQIQHLRDKIDRNREEIDYWLNKDVPLEFLYIRIGMMSKQNENWIKRIKAIQHEQ